MQILTFEQILLILREAVKKVFGYFFLKKVTDKSKFEKFYKKVHTSIDNFFYLCYTNMNYYVKLRLIDGIERRKAAEGR